MLAGVGLFIEVARTRSFRQAGETLGIAGSTVSWRIAELERNVGLPLVKRTTRRVELTESGATLFEGYERIAERRLALVIAARVDQYASLVDSAATPQRAYDNVLADAWFACNGRKVAKLIANQGPSVRAHEFADANAPGSTAWPAYTAANGAMVALNASPR